LHFLTHCVSHPGLEMEVVGREWRVECGGVGRLGGGWVLLLFHTEDHEWPAESWTTLSNSI
jgi:hypothetical protein